MFPSDKQHLVHLLAVGRLYIAVDEVEAALAPTVSRQRAILDYATKVAQASHLVAAEDRQALLDAGLSQDELWDAGAIAAFFSMSNRLANATDLRPNPEFHMLGRR